MREEKPSVNMHVEHITTYLSKEEQEKLPLKDLLFVKEGDLIIGHDRHGSELVAKVYRIDDKGMHYSYGDPTGRGWGGVAGVPREWCIEEFGKYRPRVTFEHMEHLIGKDEIIPRYFEEKYDGLYLKPYWKVKIEDEHQNPRCDYMGIMRTAANKIVDLSFSTENLEVCEVLAQLAKDAAKNARGYWENVIVAGWKKKNEVKQ